MTIEQDLSKAVETLKRGRLIGMPTETVYGLAGDASNPDAVAAIYALKNRPSFNPLIAHVSSFEMARTAGLFCNLSRKLADAFWPGAMTLVLPKSEDTQICDLARAGLDTQALRYPNHPIAQELISKFGSPLVAPSANRSGRVSPTQKEHVAEEFGADLELILDGGPAVLGLESTVLAVLNQQVTLLRPGAIAKEDIEALIGPIQTSGGDDRAPKSPGMLSRHYAPNAKVRLNVNKPKDGEAFLTFGKQYGSGTLNLSEAGNLQEAAANLYAMLRQLDENFDHIAISPIPSHGLGAAINDRLIRASK